MSTIRYIVGDVFAHMADIPDNSVDLIVTSPPFLALRSYLPDGHPDKHLELGSEPTPAAYLTTLLALTREWRRILTPHGSICVELGDTYSGKSGWESAGDDDWSDGAGKMVATGWRSRPSKPADGPGWPLPKSLCLIPTSYAWALAYGYNPHNPDDRIAPWRVRNLIVWHRPNPPVGQLGDKVRPSTSYITTACVSDRRWFDLDAERGPQLEPSVQAPSPKALAAEALGHHGKGMPATGDWHANGGAPPLDCWIDGDVWTIPTHPYKGAHYATYPPALPRRLIRLMCPMHVCVVCGEPRRRIVAKSNDVTEREALAQHIRDQRAASGLTIKDLAQHFPSASGGITGCVWNWENAANVPTPEQWPVLKSLLDLSADFDGVVLGERQWTESLVEYVADGRTLAPDERDTTGYRRGGFGSLPDGKAVAASRIAPDGWSDCGHNTWRRGHVLDPFAGSGTTGQAAIDCGRDATLIDLDERNLDLARQRLGLFLEEAV